MVLHRYVFVAHTRRSSVGQLQWIFVRLITSVWRRLLNWARHLVQKVSGHWFAVKFKRDFAKQGLLPTFHFSYILTGVIPSRFKNDCLTSVCDYAFDPNTRFGFYLYILVWFYCVWLYMYWWWFFLSVVNCISRTQCWPSRPDYNKGLLLWWLDTVLSQVISGKSLDHSVSLRSGYLVHFGFRV